MTGENEILQIGTKWSEMHKKHKTNDAEFLPVAYGSLYKHSLEVKMVHHRLPALMTSENKILQIDTKWSEMRKKHKTNDTEFLPDTGAGSRRLTIFTSREC